MKDFDKNRVGDDGDDAWVTSNNLIVFSHATGPWAHPIRGFFPKKLVTVIKKKYERDNLFEFELGSKLLQALDDSLVINPNAAVK